MSEHHRPGWRLAALGCLLAAGCGSEEQSATFFQTEFPPAVRIVEVLSTPAGSQPSFIELRNDGEQPVDLAGWMIDLGGGRLPVDPRPVETSAEVARGASPTVLQPHALALIVDATAEADLVEHAACEAPIATRRAGLGPAHAAATDVLASTIEMQQVRHCLPVFTAAALGERLAQAAQIVLYQRSGEADRAAADFAGAARAVAFERTGIGARAFAPSPIGATPGTRNFYRSDETFLHLGAGRLPLATMSASPWRVGDRILELRRQARQLQAEAESTGDASLATQAEALLAEAEAVADGALPPNPLAARFAEQCAEANRQAHAALYQINDHGAVAAMVAARGRGVDVRLTTDASFRDDPKYAGAFAAFAQAGIPVTFDLAGDRDRAPLAHNKFLVVDGAWTFTGSYNPVEDEPHRIHADNTLFIGSRRVAALHAEEFATMFGGKFGTDKRGEGVAGGRFAVDGAGLAVRFSPGMTGSQLKRRATEWSATGDAARACNVTLSSGKPAIPERYRSLDPCGGPYDLLVGEVARAQSSVYFVSFSLALGDLGDVMLERINGGVDVRGVVDPTVSTRGIVEDLLEAGADVRYTPNSDPDCPAYVKPRSDCPTNPNKVWLHHKLVVIDYGTDHPVVITGSHNLSDSAESSNDETLLVIRDRAVAEAYYRMFREVYDHPQTLGQKRDSTGLPALAITEVLPAADPQAPQLVEIANLGSTTVPLAGFELWNRRDEPLGIESTEVLAPGARAVLIVGDEGSFALPAGVPVLKLEPATGRARIDPLTALVLRSRADGRWVASYDPYTAEQNLPDDLAPAAPGVSWQWAGLDSATVDGWTVELLGLNSTPGADVPTWSPKGLYSDWGDGYHLTRTVLLLMHAPSAVWTAVGEPTPGY